ncbi:hypothetical protein GCM10025771_06360 [Niveibacterium umoris]|uniref:Lysophospholipase L1-like esterase n=1 Tax=Niveibacterium umoris TaxID=1193620 RepID=A0A840BTY3_9RHOO|nr:SGNH/GDSL hydrolase family protein [Niveibacterium umoris]MBB4013817.1 lysophospholipase L1-like esterase [Niveibacterium umoris]
MATLRMALARAQGSVSHSSGRLTRSALLLGLCGLVACGGGGAGDARTAGTQTAVALEAPVWLNTGVRVMALGDSITEGWPSSYGGYRYELYRRFIALNLPVDFVGGLTNTSNGLPDPAHEGHGGWTSYELRDGRRSDPAAGNVTQWIASARPDVILLLAGTNDVYTTINDGTIAADLLALVDRVRASAPQAELFVGTTLPLRESAANARIDRFTPTVRQGISTRMQTDEHLHLVDTHAAVSVADLAPDGVHVDPQGDGNARLADAWLSAILPTLQRLNAK